MVGDKDRWRSAIGYFFSVGGTTVSWISKLQQVVALSTTEAEYFSATEASKELFGCKGSWRNWVRSMRIKQAIE